MAAKNDFSHALPNVFSCRLYGRNRITKLSGRYTSGTSIRTTISRPSTIILYDTCRSMDARCRSPSTASEAPSPLCRAPGLFSSSSIGHSSSFAEAETAATVSVKLSLSTVSPSPSDETERLS
eukprot:Amastigsp_a339619_18.p4 type:complete len:123 gc:universal Amastigsp_a339619_18:329-697(+)